MVYVRVCVCKGIKYTQIKANKTCEMTRGRVNDVRMLIFG